MAKQIKSISDNQFGYQIKCDNIQAKTPSVKDIVSFALINTGDDYSISYTYNNIIIKIETNGGDGGFPITNNEILSLLSYYNVLNQLDIITIKAYQQKNIQGYVTRTAVGNLPTSLTLTISSDIAQQKYPNKSLKWLCMHTLIHEISHLMGNVDTDNCEALADKFADIEIIKWQAIMKF